MAFEFMGVRVTDEQLAEYIAQNGGINNTTSYNDQIGSQVKGTSFSSGVSNTSNTTQIIDGICEGPIEGWPTSDSMKHVYLDGTPVKSYNNTINVGNLRFEFKNGTTDQSPLSQYTIIGAVKSPNWLNEIDDINKIGGNGAIIQQVQIRDDTDGAYPPVEAVAFTFSFPEGLFRYRTSGGRDTTTCGIKIELNNKADGSGTWFTKVYDSWNQEITSGNFEVTYIVEIPPGWATAAGLQEYATANFADDIVQFRISKFDSDLTGPGGTPNERAHNKLYLKNYSIYTRNQFSFPYTAVAGLTIDSRNFDGSVPQRMYDLKLLKVKVPSNYTTTVDKDGKVIERKYAGVWDGTFKSTLEWTDNPAWCFYDLVTNTRYGLGNYIDPSLLNKWALYEIAKYCDAVEAEGSDQVFRTGTATNTTPRGGVPSGVGVSAVKEPRFTCNLLIKDREEAYSVVQRMASLFRGIAYFQHGQLKVIQDKPATPTYAFNNTNVVDGTFVYSSSSAKARHTVAIVRWLDPDDLYSEKLEYVEDYDGIARYGYREIELDGFGCTSKGQARRIGRHILITEKTELETVNFKTGMEGAVVTVGTLIKVKDSLRQAKRAGGRIVSATSNTITVDASTEIPTGATNIILWVETPTALDETIESNTYATYKPTLTSHAITQVAGASYTSFTLSTGTFSTTPSAGNLWMLSYTPSGSTENNTIYKVLSVVENNSYEYEITAIQSQADVAPYANKYDAIEAYAPLPEYKPPKFKLYIPAPTEGWFSVSTPTKGIYTVKLTWRMDRNISGIKYRVAVKPSSGKPVVIANNILDTTFTYDTTQRGLFYFYIYTLSYNGKQRSDPFVIGPVTIRDILPQNNFDVFNQTSFTSNSITNTWDDDQYPNDTLAFELWKSSSNSLRTVAASNKTISSIDYINKTITLTNFDQSTLTNSPDTYRVESPIYPYIRFKATNISKLGTTATTSTTLIALESHMRPDINIGDKVFNATRSNNPTTSDNPKSSNVTAVTITNPVPGTWFAQVTVSPAITGQVSGDTIYFYKGVVGVGLIETQPSAAIKQKIVKAKTGTNTTTIVGATGVFTNVNTNDMICNRTRGQTTAVTKVDNQTLTCNTSIASQTVGDDIAIYQHSSREGRALAKFKIDYLNPAFGGDAIILKDFFDADLVSQAKSMILVNLTRSKAAEIMSIQTSTNGIQVNYYPSITGVASDDEVILIRKDEVFLSSINTFIHPAVSSCTTGTTSSVVVGAGAGFFASTLAGDILVNVRRNTSAVITNVNTGTNTVTLAGATISDFIIDGQVPGDGIFVISAASIASSFNENLAYNHPSMYTAAAGTNTTTLVATNIITNTGATSSYILYNATRNAYSAITSVSSPSTINLTSAITGQTTGDIIYVFLPSTVSTTTVTAPDGAFKHARPGDLFWNKTRNAVSTILDVTTLTGRIDKKLDKLVLNSAIASQAAGDEFIIFQGYYSGIPTAFTNNGSDDKITLKTLTGLNIGDQVNVYSMNATRVGITQANTITDTGLTPNTTYYYWMRVVNPTRPFITGPWKPTDTTGDSGTTLPFGVVNYTGTNDTNQSAITIPISGSTITGAKNKDSTYDVNLKWEWLGHPPTLDGFTLYFWSSGSSTDDATVVNDEDYVKAQTGYSVPKNTGTKITAYSTTTTPAPSKSTTTNLVAGGTAVIVASTTGLVAGQKVTKTAGAGAFGSGSGLTLNTVTRSGELRRISSIAAGGTGYNLGDIVSVAGGTGGTVRVTGRSGTAGTVTAVTVHSVGTGYSNASGATTTLTYSNGPYITSIDSGTQFSVSVNHATGGAITFNCEQAITVTTPTKGISIGDPIRIGGVQGLTNLNTTSTTSTTPGTDHYIVTNTTATTVTFNPTLTISGTYTASTGILIPCKYSYTVNNITANYYFNAWGQPYRYVNSTISENNIITGDVRMIYNG